MFFPPLVLQRDFDDEGGVGGRPEPICDFGQLFNFSMKQIIIISIPFASIMA